MKALKSILAAILAALLVLGAVSCVQPGSSKGSENTENNGGAKKTNDQADISKTADAGSSDNTSDSDKTDEKTYGKFTQGESDEVPEEAVEAVGKIVGVYNNSSITLDNYVDIAMNGAFLNEELKTFYKDIMKIDDYGDTEETLVASFKEVYDSLEEDYGAGFCFFWETDYAEKYDSETIDSVKTDIEDVIRELEKYVASYEELDSYDIEELCDTVGGTKEDIGKVLSDVKVILEALKNAEVTDGYEIDGYSAIESAKTDEPVRSTTYYDVFMIDGVWICDDGFSAMFSKMLDLAGDLFYRSV